MVDDDHHEAYGAMVHRGKVEARENRNTDRDVLIDAFLSAKDRYCVFHSHTKPPSWEIRDVYAKITVHHGLGWSKAEAKCERMNAELKIDAVVKAMRNK